MNVKWIGAVFVILACGSCGYLMAARHRYKVKQFRDLIAALNYMESELRYRNTPLPQLCRLAGEKNYGKISEILLLLADELEAQISPNAGSCMSAVLDKLDSLDAALCEALVELGVTFGRFDAEGQLRGMENVRNTCQEKLHRLSQNLDCRLRNYQTLGLCAGVAIAILFV